MTTCHRSGVKFKGTQLPDPPWTWVEIELEHHSRQESTRKANRTIDLSYNKYCSVDASIAENSKITSSFTIIEAEE